MYVLKKFWCKFPEDGENAEKNMQELSNIQSHMSWNCAGVGVTKVLTVFSDIL